ncbi:hypothetical protein lerEdw1_009742 [Lerista edwardsae]|nr:hypothetical protein lerEdw1_009742 [Lerista edwardsae]
MESTIVPTDYDYDYNIFEPHVILTCRENTTCGLLWEKLRTLLVVSYSLDFVLGTIGNGLVIFITGFRVKKTVNTIWILNLAIADFTISIFLLLSIVQLKLGFHGPFGHAVCKLNKTVFYFTPFASIYLLVVISIDRCLFVWCPVWAQNHCTPRLASFVVLGVWILAFVLCSPNLYFQETYYSEERNTMYCFNNYDEIDEIGRSIKYSMVLIRFIFGFLIPFSVIVVCSGAILVKLRRDQLSHSSKPFKVITAVIVAFLICWFPFHFFSIFELNVPNVAGMQEKLLIGFTFSSILAYFNSCLNPILYFCVGHNFKEKLSCSLLSALANAFTEEGNPNTTDTKARSCMELESHGL